MRVFFKIDKFDAGILAEYIEKNRIFMENERVYAI